MDVESILAALKEERNRIDTALEALSGIGGGNGRKRGRPGRRPGIPLAFGSRKRKARRLSAAARRKISEAAKARWAQAKKAGRNSL